ncbi:hypothetical protein B0J17DRAFT_680180 [Rhizoctonia solani]|nr:hypothetical protein B0J17DRAFT_680180 [Rhizoctonia solani]
MVHALNSICLFFFVLPYSLYSPFCIFRSAQHFIRHTLYPYLHLHLYPIPHLRIIRFCHPHYSAGFAFFERPYVS